MTRTKIQSEILQFYQHRDARLRSRLLEAADLEQRVLLMKAIHRNRRSMIKLMGCDTFFVKPLDLGGKSSTIRLQDTSTDGGPGSGNHGHEGVPGQVGGSAPSGVSGITSFKRSGDMVTITSDVSIKWRQHGKAVMIAGELSSVEDFAGVEGKKAVRVEEHLIDQFGGQPGTWRHTKGIGSVRKRDGTEVQAEIHWFENDDVGQIKWKVKRELKPKSEESESKAEITKSEAETVEQKSETSGPKEGSQS